MIACEWHNPYTQEAIKLQLPSEGVTAIFGASGEGKSSLLRFFAGLESCVEADKLSVNGEVWCGSPRVLSPRKRQVGYVPQQGALLSHLSVEGNVRFQRKHQLATFDQKLFEELVQVFQIEHLLKQMPDALSGGERQRCLMVLALLVDPKWLLLDEAFSGIGSHHKKALLKYIKAFAEKKNIPVCFVSHQLDEILLFADFLVLMKDSKPIVSGIMLDILNSHQPQGLMSKGKYQVVSMQVERVQDGLCTLKSGQFCLHVINSDVSFGEQVHIVISAKDVSVSLAQSHSSLLNQLPASIVGIECHKTEGFALITLNLGETKIFAQISMLSLKKLRLELGMQVVAQIKATALTL